MTPVDYAQLLYETLENKSDEQQGRVIARFRNLLVKNKDSHLVPGIEKELKKIQKQKDKEQVTYISSASKLSESQRGELKNMFSEPLSFSENPSLLAGIAVIKKDTVYNATLRKKLESLKSLI